MQRIIDKVVEYINAHPEGVTDSQITFGLGLKNHSQANQRCRMLEAQGLVKREKIGGIIHNFPKDGITVQVHLTPTLSQHTFDDKPWYWEGKVQDALLAFLRAQGFTITRFSDTGSKERGKDIEAQRESTVLWVTVKGFPEGTERTPASTQAGHWFKHALYDIIAWRGENKEVDLALALPDFPRYRTLADTVSWLQPIAKFSFMWVREDGSVSCVTSWIPR